MVLFYSFVSLFAIASKVLAGPIKRTAVTAQLLNTLELYEQYAAAAYCPGNNDSPNTKIDCTSNACPLVEAANTNSVIEFQNTNKTDTTGFLATDATNQLIVLSYRGSESLQNYLTDIDFPLVSIDLCDGCEGETGFWNSWVESRDLVIAAVQATVQANPAYKVVATGHSLGAAVATFAAAELRKSGILVDLCTFGSPRVGNPTTATYITNQANTLGANYRVAHLKDIVPRLPPEDFGYKHVEPEYYISSANNVTVTVNDIQTCDCNENWLVPDVSDHEWYFNAISSCYPSGSNEF